MTTTAIGRAGARLTPPRRTTQARDEVAPATPRVPGEVAIVLGLAAVAIALLALRLTLLPAGVLPPGFAVAGVGAASAGAIACFLVAAVLRARTSRPDATSRSRTGHGAR